MSSTTRFNIPISKGRNAAVELPRDGLDEADFKRINDWLELVTGVLTEPGPKPALYLDPRRGSGVNTPPSDPPPTGGMSQ